MLHINVKDDKKIEALCKEPMKILGTFAGNDNFLDAVAVLCLKEAGEKGMEEEALRRFVLWAEDVQLQAVVLYLCLQGDATVEIGPDQEVRVLRLEIDGEEKTDLPSWPGNGQKAAP